MKKLITMLSTLTITTSVLSSAVACNKGVDKTDDDTKIDETNDNNNNNDKDDKDDIKGEQIILSEINADMIINWNNEYKWQDENNSYKQMLVDADELYKLSNSSIERIMQDNVQRGIIAAKVTGIDKLIFINQEKPAEDEIKDYLIYTFLMGDEPVGIEPDKSALTVKVDSSTGKDDKKFVVNINLKKWDDISENTEKVLKYYQEYKKDDKDPDWERNEYVSKYAKQINMESIKTMYDLIKEENAIIEVDLNKQKVEQPKGEELDVKSLTADTIINWKNEYEIVKMGEKVIVKASDLATLEKSQVKQIFNDNLNQIFLTKLNGINKDQFLEDQANKRLDPKVIKKLVGYYFLSEQGAYKLPDEKDVINIVINDDPDSKTKFKVDIKIRKWDEIEEQLQAFFYSKQQNAWEIKDKPILNLETYFAKYLLKINFDSVKQMYDLIKGENQTIEIDLA